MGDHEDVTNGELHRLMLANSRVLDEIRADVKTQNGKVADHAVRLAVLEERSGGGGKQGAVAGGIVGGVVTLVEVLRHFFAKP